MIGKCNNYNGEDCKGYCKVCKFFEWVNEVPANAVKYEKNNLYKPPLGIEPKNIWKLKRMKDLASVIKRYAEETLKGRPIEINKEWIEEYNDLVWYYFGEK